MGDIYYASGRKLTDTVGMNGIGVGTSVGLGVIIGLGIVSPGAEVIEYVTTFLVYGVITGFVFHAWQWALQGWKPPFLRH